MIKKYRKLPITVSAIQYKIDAESVQEVLNFVSDKCNLGFLGDFIIIGTLEGNMTVSPYDYIIKGVNGEFYPCRQEIFEKTYEEVGEDD